MVNLGRFLEVGLESVDEANEDVGDASRRASEML